MFPQCSSQAAAKPFRGRFEGLSMRQFMRPLCTHYGSKPVGGESNWSYNAPIPYVGAHYAPVLGLNRWAHYAPNMRPPCDVCANRFGVRARVPQCPHYAPTLRPLYF